MTHVTRDPLNNWPVTHVTRDPFDPLNTWPMTHVTWDLWPGTLLFVFITNIWWPNCCVSYSVSPYRRLLQARLQQKWLHLRYRYDTICKYLTCNQKNWRIASLIYHTGGGGTPFTSRDCDFLGCNCSISACMVGERKRKTHLNVCGRRVKWSRTRDSCDLSEIGEPFDP